MTEVSKNLCAVSGEVILKAVRDAVWYERLSTWYTYHGACDVLEVLLTARNAIRLEEAQ